MSQDSRNASTTKAFVPYIPSGTVLPEFSWRAVLIGTVLGAVFGASSLYLVLKVGLTVSASIPVAVISITLFRMLSKLGLKDATILENNIVQTAGSAGESIAFGVGVTMPAIMILGFDLELTRVALVAVMGALLGILMMIPLRRALIVQQHGTLKYPEGTACAEVLKAGASEESVAASSPEAKAEAAAMGSQGVSARTIFAGFGLGLVYKTLMSAFRLWKDTPEKVFGAPFKAGSIAGEISPELLGVGYIIGPQVSALMVGGGVLAYLVLIPMIKFFGEGMTGALAPGTIPIAEMSPGKIRSAYVLYIGAGAVAAAGIISLVYGLIQAPEHGWGQPKTLMWFVIALVCMTAFVIWERRVAEPMLDVTFFKNSTFTTGTSFGMFARVHGASASCSDTVGNTNGSAPAARTPREIASATCGAVLWQGLKSEAVERMPTIGLSSASSVKPAPFRKPRRRNSANSSSPYWARRERRPFFLSMAFPRH